MYSLACAWSVAAGAIALALPWMAAAAESKPEEKKPEPPKFAFCLPLGLQSGVTNKLVLRGQRIKDAAEVSLVGAETPYIAVVTKHEDAKPPDGYNADTVGDQSLEVEVFIPSGATSHTNLTWLIKTKDGEARSISIPVFATERWVAENEPNNGFREAQIVRPGQVVVGNLGDTADADVFKIEAKAGQTLKADLWAARLGSSLDAILTWYDAQGHILSVCDDAEGHDPVLRQKAAADGPLFVVATMANERAAKTHAYLLKISQEP